MKLGLAGSFGSRGQMGEFTASFWVVRDLGAEKTCYMREKDIKMIPKMIKPK